MSNSSSGGGPGGNCPNPKGLKISKDSSETFGNGIAQLDEKLTIYSVQAKKAFPKVVASIVACKHTKVATGDGGSAKATINEMSLPHFGNQSAAFDWTVVGSGASVTIYELVIRSGNIVMAIDEGVPGTPNVGQLEAFTRLALAKLPGTKKAVNPTTTTAPPTTVPPPPTTTSTTSPPPPPPTTTPTTEPGQNTAANAPPGIAGPVPNVVGENLSPAEAKLLSDNLGYTTESSGTFGVIVASDWTVCSQSPSPGAVATTVNLVVARSC